MLMKPVGSRMCYTLSRCGGRVSLPEERVPYAIDEGFITWRTGFCCIGAFFFYLQLAQKHSMILWNRLEILLNILQKLSMYASLWTLKHMCHHVRLTSDYLITQSQMQMDAPP